MTREEAIRILKLSIRDSREHIRFCYDEKGITALSMAIKALEQEPQIGHWIDTDEGFSPCECSECKSVEFKKSKFCPNCGARMVEPQESEVKHG